MSMLVTVNVSESVCGTWPFLLKNLCLYIGVSVLLCQLCTIEVYLAMCPFCITEAYLGLCFSH